jgi:hypothetical integral membrane protein (TIGR02206 family)
VCACAGPRREGGSDPGPSHDGFVSTSVAYWVAVAIGAVVCAVLCAACRHRPGPWVVWAGRAISAVLVADAVVFLVRPLLEGTWSVRTSLPLALCNAALVVAAIACWSPRWPLAVELTYFLGMAGTLQAVITPDLAAGYPELEFFQFVVAHIGIVIAALFLVVGLRLTPRPGSVLRVFTITVAFTALVGVFDWVTGSNYMYLASPPSNATLLSLLGPWPWYLASAAGIALALLVVLDAPFHRSRGHRYLVRHPAWWDRMWTGKRGPSGGRSVTPLGGSGENLFDEEEEES